MERFSARALRASPVSTEHEDLLVLKAGLAQLLRVLHLAHGKAADALRPEQPGHGRHPRAAAVAGEHAVDDRPRRPLLDDGQIVLDRSLFNDQLAHKDSPLFSLAGTPVQSAHTSGRVIPIHAILPLLGKNSNVAIREYLV